MEEPLTDGRFTVFGKWLDKHKITMALIISAIGLAVIKDLGEIVFEWEKPWWALLLSLGAIIVTLFCAWFGSIGQSKLAKINSDLSDQLEYAEALIQNFGSDYFDLWDNRLRVLSEVLGFDARDRISVYRHQDNTFTMVGRYAVLPDYDKPGRGAYPVGQGVIGSAWRAGDGKCVVQDMPDPITDLESYCSRSKDDWNLPSAVTKKLGMKSRSVAAFALNDHTNSTRSAIIVFESTEPGRFSVDTLEHHVNGTTGKDIAHLLKILGEREPSLTFAASKGF
jgi:hypothetical protein